MKSNKKKSMPKTIIGDSEARILSDAFYMYEVNPKKIHKEGYRLNLWDRWRSYWKGYKMCYNYGDGELIYEDPSIGTKEGFDKYLRESYLEDFGDYLRREYGEEINKYLSEEYKKGLLTAQMTEEERQAERERKQAKNERKRQRKKDYKAELEEASNSLIFHHKAIEKYTVYCPLCDERFDGSNYLLTIFKDDEKALWLANMVMHYRHCHITSWNKCWGYWGNYYRKAAHFGDYDKEKAIVNERAKRQIARKCKEYVIKNGIDASVFSKLQGTTQETLDVVNKISTSLEQKLALFCQPCA